MSNDTMCPCATEELKSGNSNLTGIRLFKSVVRRVRNIISENKMAKSGTTDNLPSVVTKLEQVSIEEQNSNGSRSSPKETIKNFFGSVKLVKDQKPHCGYNSDSGAEKKRDNRVRIRQKVRSRSKSDSRQNKKKPKRILRPPASYVYIRGISGLPTQRIRVR